MRQAYGFHLRQSVVVVFAQLLRHSKGNFAVLAQEAEEIVAADEICLRRLEHVGGGLVRLPGYCRSKAQHFTRVGDAEDQRFPIGGGSGKFHFTAAKDKYSARCLPFDKKSGSLGIG